jgi:hypothetical protein
MAAEVQRFASPMDLPQTGRVYRRPEHTFYLKTQPFVLQPFLLAPVLPGETLKQMLIQSRVVTDSIKNPLIGWWHEYYIFYVKHRDLAKRDEFVKMALDPAWTPTIGGVLSAARNHSYYHGGNSINWAALCHERVVAEYFRDEGDSWNNYLIDGQPLAKINSRNWGESLILESNMPVSTVPAATDVSVPGYEQAYDRWQFMMNNKLTNMTYEDFLRTYGVRMTKEEPHKPELLRYIREWSYPTNTVEPTTGVPTSAVSWSFAERADKDRFFKEPGFIYGVTVTRPKVYSSKYIGAGAGWLNDAFSWLPALMKEDAYTSLKKQAFGTNIAISGPTSDYWVDVRDLFVYGDQFTNVAETATDMNYVALPQNALTNKYYVAQTDIDGLFTTPLTKKYVRQDGIVNLQILGTQLDFT